MRRLLLSALLAVLVHACWLYSDIGESVGSSLGKPAESLVVSLGFGVQDPTSDFKSEPTIRSQEPAPVPTPPAIEEQKAREGPPEEDGALSSAEESVPPVENDAIPTAPPITEREEAPEVQPAPETKTVTREKPKATTKVPRQEEIQKPRKRNEPAKSKQVEPDDAPTKLARREEARVAPSKSSSTEYDTGPPNRGTAADQNASITQALKNIVKEARPIYKQNPRPPYPRVARRRGYEGTVIVKALVGTDGRVNDVRLDESSGHDTLDGAALKTVRKWAFEPALRGSEKIEMWVRIPLRFSLD